jgi:hypothetical protein
MRQEASKRLKKLMMQPPDSTFFPGVQNLSNPALQTTFVFLPFAPL